MAARQRPLTQLAVVATAAHVFFELGAGVGMPGASVLGPVPAAGLWGAGTAATTRRARSAPATADTRFAVVDTVCLAAAIAHLLAWPTRRTAPGLPWLTECEGLGPELMPAYNSMIYAGGLAASAALITENRSGSRRRAFAALAAVPVLMAVQRWEFARLRAQARTRPGWWNRRLREA